LGGKKLRGNRSEKMPCLKKDKRSLADALPKKVDINQEGS
jgi:hypothetical protein